MAVPHPLAHVTLCAQATFQQCALQSQMDLKMGGCMYTAALQHLVPLINYVMLMQTERALLSLQRGQEYPVQWVVSPVSLNVIRFLI